LSRIAPSLLSIILFDETLKCHTQDLGNRSTCCCTGPSKYHVPDFACDTCLGMPSRALLYNEHKATLGLTQTAISLLLYVDIPMRDCMYPSSHLVVPHGIAFADGRGGLSITGCATFVSWACGSSICDSSTSGSKASWNYVSRALFAKPSNTYIGWCLVELRSVRFREVYGRVVLRKLVSLAVRRVAFC
jgi:hypothetical protein